MNASSLKLVKIINNQHFKGNAPEMFWKITILKEQKKNTINKFILE